MFDPFLASFTSDRLFGETMRLVIDRGKGYDDRYVYGNFCIVTFISILASWIVKSNCFLSCLAPLSMDYEL